VDITPVFGPGNINFEVAMRSFTSAVPIVLNSLGSCQGEAPQMQSSLFDNCKKTFAANKPLYLTFIDLEKAFDRVPREVIWWSKHRLGIDEWLVRLVQSMYCNVKSRVRVGNDDEFPVGIGVHQGSVLSSLLFIIVLEELSKDFNTGCPWKLLYADDLVIMSDTLDALTDNRQIPLETRGHVYSACVENVMLYDSETWAIPMSTESTYPCQHKAVSIRNEWAMLRWMYGS
jgi:hypothetical protein